MVYLLDFCHGPQTLEEMTLFDAFWLKIWPYRGGGGICSHLTSGYVKFPTWPEGDGEVGFQLTGA